MSGNDTDRRSICRKLSFKFGIAAGSGVALLAAGLCGAIAFGAPAPELSQSTIAPALALGDAFAAIADQTKNQIVSVLSEKIVKSGTDEMPLPFDDPLFRQFFGNPFAGPHGHKQVPLSGLGSGFILDEDGHILTNDHVVQGTSKIRVVLSDKRSFDAAVVGSDEKTDIAVLRLKGSVPKDLTAARLGNSDTLKPGHLVLAFGAPFGLTQTVTSGIVSATGRSNVGIADFEDFVQTDAPINPGNSGGPLVNMRGEVVGINTAIAGSVGQSAGVGFAIPINMAKDILPTLLQGKKVVRGMLGIEVQDLTPDLERQFHLSNTLGALVSHVNPGSPAEKAGIETGDVIIKLGRNSIQDSTELRDKVSKDAPGASEGLGVVRNGKEITLTAKLGELRSEKTETASASAPGGPAPLEKYGIEAKDLTPELATEFNLKEKKGVVITDVDPMSTAGMANLQPGDVITEVDRKKVDSVVKADNVLAQAKHKGEVLLLVNHQGGSAYVTLETG